MIIKTITVIGASGTMGTNVSAIFASFGNATVYMISRDIEKSKKAIQKAVKSVRADSIATKLIPADYSMLGECVKKSDLIFESIVEDLEAKKDVSKKIEKHLKDSAVVCSGTSGLSITELAESFPEKIRSQYFGVHMFNPPYNMTLCELITTKYSNEKIKEELKDYLKNVLYRAVIETKDKPAFLANRIGFQFINQAMIFAEKYKDNGGIDYIDAILGSFTGRAMAPLVTADFVGLDVHKAIVDNVYNNSIDYAHGTFIIPEFAKQLIQNGKLGRKSGAGLYKSEINSSGVMHTTVYDINTQEYREKNYYVFPFAEEMKAYIKVGDYARAFESIINNHSQEAEICLKFLLNYIVYSLVTIKNVAYDICDADIAMATGFNWCPPIAMIDAFSSVVDVKILLKDRLDEDILKNVNINELLLDIKTSNYDYRPYFKSER